MYGDQCNHVLCSSTIQHIGIREQSCPLLRRDHWCDQRALNHRINLLSRQIGEAFPLIGSRGPNVPSPIGDSHNPRDKSFGLLEQPRKRLRDPSSDHGVHVCLGLCLVMGPAWVANTERDFPSRDAFGGPERDGLCQFALHFCDSASVFVNVVPF